MVAFRNFGRSLSKWDHRAATQVEEGPAEALNRLFKVNFKNTPEEAFERILHEYHLLFEYRSCMLTLSSDDKKRVTVSSHAKNSGCRIASLSYAISPRSPVGLFVIFLMDLTPATFSHMPPGVSKALESLFVPSMEAELGIPSYYQGLARYVREGLVPFLE